MTGAAGSAARLQNRRPLVIGCGALGAELVELTRRAGLPAMDLACLPASLHNHPARIPAAVAARIAEARAHGYDRIFVAYADCGTAGRLDRVLEEAGVDRLEGAHCYEVYAGRAAFAALADDEPGTFYLTDFLARSFEALVVRGLGLDRFPQLAGIYFRNYRRLVYLAQTHDPELTARAEAAARRLGLAFERRFTGLGDLAPAVAAFATSPTPSTPSTAMTEGQGTAPKWRRGAVRRPGARVPLTVRQDPGPEGTAERRRRRQDPPMLTLSHRGTGGEVPRPRAEADRADPMTPGHRRLSTRNTPEAAGAA